LFICQIFFLNIFGIRREIVFKSTKNGEKMKKNKQKKLPAECVSILITLIAEAIVKIINKTRKGVKSWTVPTVK